MTAVLRRATLDDLEQCYYLAKKSLLPTLPDDRRLIEQKLQRSDNSFKKRVEEPEDELYLFVLEEATTGTIIGISGIEATTGGRYPLYFFRKEALTSKSLLAEVTKTIPILAPISYVHGPSELCSLFLQEEHRSKGFGKLLSFARFHFMVRFPERFTNSVITELLGYIENGECPFWNGIGRHFFNVSIYDAYKLLRHSKSFIPHFLPQYPIYVPLLPKVVQDVIGKTHKETEKVITLLLKQGFEISAEVDIFDGGPKLKAMTHNIKTMRECVERQVIKTEVLYATKGTTYLISNRQLQFRATCGQVLFHDDRTITLSEETAELLHISPGDWVALSPI
jgi:arginine N-succinyltransferase